MARILDGAKAAAIHLFDKGIAPKITFDVTQGPAQHLAIAHQFRAENIGEKSLGRFMRLQFLHRASLGRFRLTAP